MSKTDFKRVVVIIFMGMGIMSAASGLFFAAQKDAVPPNAPGELTIREGRILWRYEGKTLFEGDVRSEGIPYRIHTADYQDENGSVTRLLMINAENRRNSVEVAGTVTAGDQSFPCEADRRDRGLPIVRHSSGLSRSLLNRGIYDRERDWLLSVDHNPFVRITPRTDEPGRRVYALRISGGEIIIRLRPRFYQIHRGLTHYRPWTYRIKPKPITGWCSWFAYFEDITEQNIKETADVMAEALLPYGYEYLQIDDGYQQTHGLPEHWLDANKKFPSGLAALAQYIKRRGLKPGIWTNVAFDQQEYAETHKDFFVLDGSGHPVQRNWIDIPIDGSNPGALDTLIRPVYRGLREMGWDYFKVDALRHLRYEGYNSFPEHFRNKGTDRTEAFRSLALAVREEIGRESFMMGCWGIRPELIGIIDGCRIGTDGYSFAGLSQYNSFNNVVWLNDPDHIELSPEEAYRSTMVTSLTGSLFMLTDKPEVYRTAVVDPAKRAAPVLFTLPGQVFDVDPSRSSQLHQVHTEVSGSGPRSFDAGLVSFTHLFQLEIDRPFENWILLGRTGGEYPEIPFKELGLEPDREYLVYEYWSGALKGSFTCRFAPGPIDPKFGCQLFCIRGKKTHPQLLASSRHLTCGGYDLENIVWENTTLRGRSKLVAGDPYVLTITEPEGFLFIKASCEGADLVTTENHGGLLLVHLRSSESRSIAWSIEFETP